MKYYTKINIFKIISVFMALTIAFFPAFKISNAKTLKFTDAHGEKHKFKINENANKTIFKKSDFKLKNKKMTFSKSGYRYELGVDVSRHQGNINWKKVKKAGYKFAFIRIGYRGYVNGSLNLDSTAIKNLKNARKAGIKTGVYFFSQAINKKEAIEEARFVIRHLKGVHINLPIVYDPESILNAKARTDKISKKTFTKNTIAFVKTVRKAGFKAMLYCNLMWEAYKLNMSKLKNIPIWYADYERKPQTPYRFTYWQYTCTAKVPGINTNADVNIRLIRKNK